MLTIRVHGQERLQAVAARLADEPEKIRHDLRNALNAAGRPAVEDVRRAVRTADIHGFKRPFRWTRDPNTGKAKRRKMRRFVEIIPQSPVRPAIARAVELDIATAGDPRVEIKVVESRVPPRIRKLVKYIAGAAQRWRHPVMGDRDVWVGQHAPNVWWPTLRRHLPMFRRNVSRAIDRAAQRIERQG